MCNYAVGPHLRGVVKSKKPNRRFKRMNSSLTTRRVTVNPVISRHDRSRSRRHSRLRRRRRRARAQSGDAARRRLRRRRLRAAAGRHRLDLEHGHALQHAHRRAGATPPRRESEPRAGATSSSTPSPSPTASRWAREGMSYSLVSREVIADSIETVVGAEGFDGLVAIGGCDKNMPGCLMAHRAAQPPGRVRLRRHDPARASTGSATSSRCSRPSARMPRRTSTTRSSRDIERTAIPGPGSCGGMYTANTMACAIEALGMSLPNSSAQEAVSEAKRRRLPARRRSRRADCSSEHLRRATS